MCDAIRRRLRDLDYSEDEIEAKVSGLLEEAYDTARDLQSEQQYDDKQHQQKMNDK